MSSTERARIASKAGLTVTEACTYTGADLCYKALITTSGQTGSKDAPTLLRAGGSA